MQVSARNPTLVRDWLDSAATCMHQYRLHRLLAAAAADRDRPCQNHQTGMAKSVIVLFVSLELPGLQPLHLPSPTASADIRRGGILQPGNSAGRPS